MKRRRWLRISLFALVAVLAAGVAAPFLDAHRFTDRVRAALEQGLGRRVEINGKLHFTLFGGPGFRVADVVIHEDPSISLEPFAYVTELEARVGLASFWTRSLQFSTLRLNEPTVNLARLDAGGWNLQRLLAKPLSQARRLPEFEVRGGRINLRFGDTKSVFYLLDTDIDFTPSETSLSFRFSGEPARSDRPAQGFGAFSGRGTWQRPSNAESRLDLQLELEPSNIAELARLFPGEPLGLHGHLSSRARLSGPVSNARIQGSLKLQDVHRWDRQPAPDIAWEASYTGALDIANERLEFDTAAANPVAFRLRVSRLLTEPRWATDVTFRKTPAAGLFELARHMGAPIDSGLALEGVLNGVVGYSRHNGLQGQVSLDDARLTRGGADPLEIASALIQIDSPHVRLESASVTVDEKEVATLQGAYQVDDRALELQIGARGMPVAELRASAGGLLGVGAIPAVEFFESGICRGNLRYRQASDTPGEWTGDLAIAQLRFALPGLAEPITIDSGRLLIRGARVAANDVSGAAGPVAFTADYRYEPETPRPHRFRLLAGEVKAADLEKLFLPTLRRREGFLARTLRLTPAPMPDWLRQRHAEGVVTFARLAAGPLSLDNLHGRLTWDGARVDLSGATFAVGEAEAAGAVTLNLARHDPVYHVAGQLHGLATSAGAVDIEGAIDAGGIGADLVASARAAGKFTARSFQIAPDSEAHDVSGALECSFPRSGMRLRAPVLQLAIGPDVFNGAGGSAGDGKLAFDLLSGRKQVRVTGTLSPLELEMLPVAAAR